MNLLTETVEAITESGHTVDDIKFIGSLETGVGCSWDEFQIMADREYDNGYGGHVIPLDLEVVFKDGGRLIREEYDGAEDWRILKPLNLADMVKKRFSLAKA